MTLENTDALPKAGPANDDVVREQELAAMLILLANALASLQPGPESELCRRTGEKLAGERLTLIQIRAMKRQLADAASELVARKSAAESAGAGSDQIDHATGLQNAAAAEASFSRHLQEHETGMAAIIVLDQLRALNTRFGRAVGDQVLALAATDLNRELSAVGQLYRWNGPAFVLLANASAQQESLDERFRAIAARRLEKTVAVENRSIHIKLTLSWEIQPLNSSSTPAIVARDFDQYVATRLAT